MPGHTLLGCDVPYIWTRCDDAAAQNDNERPLTCVAWFKTPIYLLSDWIHCQQVAGLKQHMMYSSKTKLALHAGSAHRCKNGVAVIHS